MPDPTVNPQPENTSVVIRATSTQDQAAEAIAKAEVKANGAQPGTAQAPTPNMPQLMNADEVRVLAGEGKARIIHIGNKKGEHELLATLCEDAGLHAQAAAIRGAAADPSIGGMVKRTWRRKVAVSDVVVFAIGVTVLVLVYEGIAYKFDLPRYGVWDPSKALKK